MKLFRREFLHLMAGAAAVPSVAIRLAWAQKTPRRVRVATGLLATWQSTACLEAGFFKKREIELSLPTIAVGGQEAAAGLIRGDWEFAIPAPCRSPKDRLYSHPRGGIMDENNDCDKG